MGLRFNTLLAAQGFAPEEVSLVYHLTKLQPLRRLMPALAERHPDLFDAYQSVHSLQAERTLAARPYFATFVPRSETDCVFVGLYRIDRKDHLPVEEIYADPRFEELETRFGATDTTLANNLKHASGQTRFQTTRLEEMADLRGRVIVLRPGGRAYVRLASNLDPEISELLPEPVFNSPCPEWRDVLLTAREIRELPSSWASRLAEWRGIYCIVDESDGSRYVGSAYGEANLLGRWRAHVAREVGVTVELQRRDVLNFRFSILERVSPDMPSEDVIRLERTWMNRLDTCRFGLNA